MFKDYPTLVYNLEELTNILIRFDFINFFNNSEFSDQYVVMGDSDTPESMALSYYGDSKYSWIVLMLNNYFNRELDWPLTGNKMNIYLEKKYNYSSLFFLEANIDFSFSTVKKIKYGSISHDVKSYDRTFNRIDLVTKVSTSLKTSTNISLYDEDNKVIKTLKPDKVVYEAKYALHHFENSAKEYLNPRSTIGGQSINYIHGYINPGSESLVEAVISINLDNDNYINDNKRTITMLKNEYVDNFIESIKYIIDGMNDRKDVEDA